MSNHRIGILYNRGSLRKLTRGKTKQKTAVFYEHAARQKGLIPCFFRIEDVDVRNMKVMAYVKGQSGYTRYRIPIPQVIHNRALYKHSSSHARIRSLVQSNITLFNQVTRYNKMDIHNLLATDRLICPYLPTTMPANLLTVNIMMKNHQTLVLKPNNSSVGRGIMKLEQTGRGWKTTYRIRTTRGVSKWKVAHTCAGTLPAAVKSRLAKKAYVVQQMLPLAHYRGRPFDLRVSVQRDGTGAWKITGIVGKVAPSYTFLTNVAQGGTVYRFEHLALASFPHIPVEILYKRVSDFSLLVANRLSDTLPQLADIGLDIGLSSSFGMPLFIECNGRDQRYSFRKANLYDAWRATYANPIAYGALLLSQH